MEVGNFFFQNSDNAVPDAPADFHAFPAWTPSGGGYFFLQLPDVFSEKNGFSEKNVPEMRKNLWDRFYVQPAGGVFVNNEEIWNATKNEA